MADVISFPVVKRDCYACFDFERSGDRNCVVCGRPVGSRLPPHLRPPQDPHFWENALREAAIRWPPHLL